MSSSERTNFVEMLRDVKLKVTPQRIAILEQIQKNGHFSIEEIYEDVLKMFPSISLATVYKNIHSLMESDIIREIKVPGHKSKYQISGNSRSYMGCSVCGLVENIETPNKKAPSSASKWKIVDTMVMFIGICPKCKK